MDKMELQEENSNIERNSLFSNDQFVAIVFVVVVISTEKRTSPTINIKISAERSSPHFLFFYFFARNKLRR